MSSSGSTRRPIYQPILLALIFICGGILIDRCCDFDLPFWLMGAVFFLVSWWCLWAGRKFRFASLTLMLTLTCLGGSWHHLRWNYFGESEIGLFATDRSAPCSIRAIAVESPYFKLSKPASRFADRKSGVQSQLKVRVISIRDGENWVDASGHAQLLVDGQLEFVSAGDEIEIQGKLLASQSARNPGEFDFYQYNRRQGRFCLITAKHPQSIVVRQQHRAGPLDWMPRLRRNLDQQIRSFIHEDRAPMASAILLGNRQSLSREMHESFLVSGTIHILAISGLHVGILAAGLLFLGRVEMIGRRKALWATMIIVLAYAWLVEFRPPVLRASILVALYCGGRLTGRDGFSGNILAFAAILVLVLNPTDLFSAGAQLSFLAVSTLSFSRKWLHLQRSNDPLDQLIERTRPFWQRVLRNSLRKSRQAFMVSFVIWLAAMPLVALRFNLVSPVAILVNPILMIPLAIALYSGFGTLLFGWIFPPLASGFGKICDVSLLGIENLIEISRELPGSYFWTCGPSQLSVFLFYFLFLVSLAYRPTRVSGRWLLVLFVAWISFGWFLPNLIQYRKQKSRPTVATFIDVGHGTSVLIQLPEGQNLLYDCGSFGAPEKGARRIAGVLWEKQIGHLDAVIISHSDLDHFNCLPEIASRFSIGVVYVSPVMFEDRAASVRELFLALEENGIAVRTIEAGDEMDRPNSKVAISVLSPPAEGTHDSDNSDSVVLAIRSGETRLLLPGDLEGNGMMNLLQTQQGKFDFAMAPHHGSRNSLPNDFVNWADPHTVIVSGQSNLVDSSDWLKFESKGIRVLRTEDRGAIDLVLEKPESARSQARQNLKNQVSSEVTYSR